MDPRIKVYNTEHFPNEAMVLIFRCLGDPLGTNMARVNAIYSKGAAIRQTGGNEERPIFYKSWQRSD